MWSSSCEVADDEASRPGRKPSPARIFFFIIKIRQHSLTMATGAEVSCVMTSSNSIDSVSRLIRPVPRIRRRPRSFNLFFNCFHFREKCLEHSGRSLSLDYTHSTHRGASEYKFDFFNECKSSSFGAAGMCFSSPLGPMGAFLLDFHPTDKMASCGPFLATSAQFGLLAGRLIGRVAVWLWAQVTWPDGFEGLLNININNGPILEVSRALTSDNHKKNTRNKK